MLNEEYWKHIQYVHCTIPNILVFILLIFQQNSIAMLKRNVGKYTQNEQITSDSSNTALL